MRLRIRLLCCLLGARLASATVHGHNKHETFEATLKARSILQGWSLQSASCPSGTHFCGSGSCCPSSLFCVSAASAEVAACCPSCESLNIRAWFGMCLLNHSFPCRDAIEGNPVCADSSWSLWKGFQVNGFCCLVGLTGYYISNDNTAGACASTAVPGATSATLVRNAPLG